MAKAYKVYNTCIAQAAYRSCSGAFCVTEWAYSL